MYKKPRI